MSAREVIQPFTIKKVIVHLTHRTDHHNAPPAASVAMRERTALWCKPQPSGTQPGHIQVLEYCSTL